MFLRPRQAEASRTFSLNLLALPRVVALTCEAYKTKKNSAFSLTFITLKHLAEVQNEKPIRHFGRACWHCGSPGCDLLLLQVCDRSQSSGRTHLWLDRAWLGCGGLCLWPDLFSRSR